MPQTTHHTARSSADRTGVVPVAGRTPPPARPPASDVFNADCPCRPILDRVADKWTALVMGALEPGTKRFQQLRREVGGVSQKMLTQTLRALERDGLVARRVYAAVPPRVEYTLTPLGRDLTEPLGALRRWVETHRDAVLAAQARYDAGPPNAE
jgi:DNA-binding HxlR family transcriptional regulator